MINNLKNHICMSHLTWRHKEPTTVQSENNDAAAFQIETLQERPNLSTTFLDLLPYILFGVAAESAEGEVNYFLVQINKIYQFTSSICFYSSPNHPRH